MQRIAFDFALFFAAHPQSHSGTGMPLNLNVNGDRAPDRVGPPSASWAAKSKSFLVQIVRRKWVLVFDFALRIQTGLATASVQFALGRWRFVFDSAVCAASVCDVRYEIGYGAPAYLQRDVWYWNGV
eukprot:106069-Rhodomonas_salina.1